MFEGFLVLVTIVSSGVRNDKDCLNFNKTFKYGKKMEIASADAVFDDEREEGEIVEDDLEDVSDCSMSSGSPFFIGKSVSPPELLSAVCLSSVSSSEYSAGDGHTCVRDISYPRYGKDGGRHRPHKRKRKLEDRLPKRKRCHQSRHTTRKPGNSDTDSANEVVDPKYAKKLRVALRRESTHDLLHNSLRTRLKAFIEPNSHSEDELSLSALRDLALLSTLKSTENLDKPICEVESEEFLCIDELKDEEHQEENKESIDDNKNSVELSELPGTDVLKKDENIEHDKEESQSVESDDQTFDSELRELRIAALKSFVLENHKRRRRKAAIENHTSSKENDETDVDKENDKSIINNDSEGKCSKKLVSESEKENENENALEVPTAVNSPAEKGDVKTDDDNCTDCGDTLEDDADILRTMLLASMSKKLAGNPIETTDSSTQALRFPRTLSDLRKVEKSKLNHNSLSVTITKPFIRTVKNDLYSITNTNNLTKKNSSEPPNVVVKPLIINVNADSDSDTENIVTVTKTNKQLKATVTEFLKKQRAEVEASAKTTPNGSPASTLSNKSYDPLMEKSVMRLLPQSQQLEYRRLKQQLINARKKKRIRKPSQRLSESKREINKKVPKVKTDIISTNNSVPTSTKTIKNGQEKKSVEPAGNLQKALNELQIRKNGRLQMKGKYRSLAPLLHRINQASYERRQHEIEIKKQLLQIQKARMKLAASHQLFTTLVHQLLCEKNTIDQRVLKMVKFPQNSVFTSTPNRLVNKKIKTCDISLVNENCSVTEDNTKTCNDSTKNNNTPGIENKIGNITTNAEELKNTNETDSFKIEKEVLLDSNNKKEDNDKEEMLDSNDKQVLDSNDKKEEALVDQNIPKEEVILDPNDIMKVFVEQPMIVESTTFPKYTSPLHNRDGINDPLTTFCPYDLLGVCKDKECRYMHCS